MFGLSHLWFRLADYMSPERRGNLKPCKFSSLTDLSTSRGCARSGFFPVEEVVEAHGHAAEEARTGDAPACEVVVGGKGMREKSTLKIYN
jgi:hypothetical protein